MSAKDDLRAWVTARAASPDDARTCSALIAAFVAECVRADREAQGQKARRSAEIRKQFDDLAARFRDTPFGTGRHG